MTVLGAPFALTLMAANIVGFYTAKVYTIFWGANWVFGRFRMKHNHMPAFLCGTIVYFGLTLIPVFGTIVSFVAMLLGFGAGVMAQSRKGGVLDPEHMSHK
jgi:hypothetical protein